MSARKPKAGKQAAEAIEPATADTVVIKTSTARGLTFEDAQGQPLRLAVITATGEVLEQGVAFARDVWDAVSLTIQNDWASQGHLKTERSRTGSCTTWTTGTLPPILLNEALGSLTKVA